VTLPNIASDQPAVKLQTVYITDNQLARRWLCTKVTLWRKRRDDPRVPRPVKGINAFQNLCLLSEVEAYEARLLAEREAMPVWSPKPGQCAKAGCFNPIVPYSGFGRRPCHCEQHAGIRSRREARSLR
jgi:hypothetical protein